VEERRAGFDLHVRKVRKTFLTDGGGDNTTGPEEIKTARKMK